MKQGSIILLLFSLAPWFLTKAEEAIAYDYDGFPTIIHNETASLQEYRPKFWYLHVDTKDGGFINLDYRLAGDTLIQEKHYVRVVFGYEEKKIYLIMIFCESQPYAPTVILMPTHYITVRMKIRSIAYNQKIIKRY
jgi:hypothetical protein